MWLAWFVGGQAVVGEWTKTNAPGQDDIGTIYVYVVVLYMMCTGRLGWEDQVDGWL